MKQTSFNMIIKEIRTTCSTFWNLFDCYCWTASCLSTLCDRCLLVVHDPVHNDHSFACEEWQLLYSACTAALPVSYSDIKEMHIFVCCGATDVANVVVDTGNSFSCSANSFKLMFVFFVCLFVCFSELTLHSILMALILQVREILHGSD